MGEIPTSEHVEYPILGPQEFMERYGFNEHSTYFPSPAEARAAMGREVTKARLWLQRMTGWEFDQDDNISEEVRSMAGDAIGAMAAHFVYMRIATIRLDQAADYRLLSAESKAYAKELMMILRRTKKVAKVITKTSTYLKEHATEV